jgi:hypothetical protein
MKAFKLSSCHPVSNSNGESPFSPGIPGWWPSWLVCPSYCKDSLMILNHRANTKLYVSGNYCYCSLTSLNFKLNSYQHAIQEKIKALVTSLP